MQILCSTSQRSTLVILEDNEIDKMLTYIEIALKEKIDCKERAFDFLCKNNKTQKYCLFFQSKNRELLIRVLTLIMHSHGIEQNFAAEEKMRTNIETMKEGFNIERKLH